METNSIDFDDYKDNDSDFNEYKVSNPIVMDQKFTLSVPQLFNLEDSFRESEDNHQYTDAFEQVKSIVDDSPLKQENLELNDRYLMMEDLTPTRD